jgi:hypothetical protein
MPPSVRRGSEGSPWISAGDVRRLQIGGRAARRTRVRGVRATKPSMAAAEVRAGHDDMDSSNLSSDAAGARPRSAAGARASPPRLVTAGPALLDQLASGRELAVMGSARRHQVEGQLEAQTTAGVAALGGSAGVDARWVAIHRAGPAQDDLTAWDIRICRRYRRSRPLPAGRRRLRMVAVTQTECCPQIAVRRAACRVEDRSR